MSSLQISARWPWSAGALLAILLGAECVVVLAVWSGTIGPHLGLAAHAAETVAFAFIARSGFRQHVTIYVVVLLTTAFMGPLGAVAGLGLLLTVTLAPIPAADLDSWHRRLSGAPDANVAVQLYEKILDGRAMQPSEHAGENFFSVLDGPLVQQQNLLGLIGLDYHPEYLAILRQALRSSEPSIRVHAAAVYVKLRARSKAAFQRAATSGGAKEAVDSLERAAALQRVAESGFLDATDQRIARNRAIAECEIALAKEPQRLDAKLLLFRLLADANAWEDVISRGAPSQDGLEQYEPYLASLMHLRHAKRLNAALKVAQSPLIEALQSECQ
jgi:hypothetical protein